MSTDYQMSLLCFGETVSLEHFTSSTRTPRLLSLETAKAQAYFRGRRDRPFLVSVNRDVSKNCSVNRD